MIKRSHWAALLALSTLVGFMTAHQSANAANAQAGKAKAQPCSVCHGATGISTLPDAPNIAGQPEIYLTNQLRAFRSGDRRNEVMSLVAKALSDADIADLAAWFSSIHIEVKPP